NAVAALARPGDPVVTYCADKMTAFRFYLGRAYDAPATVMDLPPVTHEAISGDPEGDPARDPRGSRANPKPILDLARGDRPVFCLISRKAYRRIRPQLEAAHLDTVLKANR